MGQPLPKSVRSESRGAWTHQELARLGRLGTAELGRAGWEESSVPGVEPVLVGRGHPCGHRWPSSGLPAPPSLVETPKNVGDLGGAGAVSETTLGASCPQDITRQKPRAAWTLVGSTPAGRAHRSPGRCGWGFREGERCKDGVGTPTGHQRPPEMTKGLSTWLSPGLPPVHPRKVAVSGDTGTATPGLWEQLDRP